MRNGKRVWWAVPLRVVIGLGLMAHGWAKLARGPESFAAILQALGVPLPGAAALATIAIELAGGAMVLAGAFLRVAALPLAAVLAVAAVTVHLPFGFSSIKLVAVTGDGPQFGPPGYEVDLLYMAALAALAIGGPGPLALVIRRRRADADAPSADLESVPPGPERDAYLPLLHLADDSPAQVRSYYQHGELFVLRGATREPQGVVLVIADGDERVELKAVAVAEPLQGRGVGRRLLALALARLRERGVRRVVVGTSNASIRAMTFYQRAGFRPMRIERDFFTERRGYPPHFEEDGIAIRDMVWLDRVL